MDQAQKLDPNAVYGCRAHGLGDPLNEALAIDTEKPRILGSEQNSDTKKDNRRPCPTTQNALRVQSGLFRSPHGASRLNSAEPKPIARSDWPGLGTP